MYRTNRPKRQGRRNATTEYQQEVVEAFLASGRTIAEVAHRYDVEESALREWIRQASDEVVRHRATGQQRPATPERTGGSAVAAAEFQAEVVAWHRTSGKTIAEVASALHLSESTVREWVWRAPDGIQGPDPGRDWSAEAGGWVDDVPGVPEVLEPVCEETDRVAAKVGDAPPAEPAAVLADAAEAVARAEAEASRAVKAKVRAERKAARAVARAEAAAEAETAARAEIAAAYAVAVEAMVGAEVAAAETVARVEAEAATAVAQAEEAAAEMQAARAEALAVQAEAAGRVEAERATRVEAEEAARAEISSVYAAAVEAVLRAEVSALEKVARADAVATDATVRSEAALAEAAIRAEEAAAETTAAGAEAAAVRAEATARVEAERAARVEAEEAARVEIAAAYSAAVEAVLRVEVSAAEKVASAEAVAAEAVTRAQAVTSAVKAAGADGAVARPDGARVEAAVARPVAPARVDAGQPGRAFGESSSTFNDEVVARAEIAQLLSRLTPVPVWIQAAGPTVAEAREAALEQLGVDAADADIEVLSQGSRWLPGRVRVRARLRVPERSGA